jgi:hypothetical protein
VTAARCSHAAAPGPWPAAPPLLGLHVLALRLRARRRPSVSAGRVPRRAWCCLRARGAALARRERSALALHFACAL